jgi:hypothetical protein
MTQREEGAAGEPAASRNSAPVSVVDSSPWAPLGQRAFRWLWLGMFIGYIGVWMQTVGAQWLLVDAPNAAGHVVSASWGSLGGLLRSALAALHGSGLLLRRSDLADRAHSRRTDAAGPSSCPYLHPGHRRGGAAPYMAGHDS